MRWGEVSWYRGLFFLSGRGKKCLQRYPGMCGLGLRPGTSHHTDPGFLRVYSDLAVVPKQSIQDRMQNKTSSRDPTKNRQSPLASIWALEPYLIVPIPNLTCHLPFVYFFKVYFNSLYWNKTKCRWSEYTQEFLYVRAKLRSSNIVLLNDKMLLHVFQHFLISDQQHNE